MHIPPFRRILLLPAALLAMAGCGATTKYYRLSSDGPVPVHTAGLFVGIGPVTLPGYIDRTELVFQSGPNEFQVPTTAIWTGTLHDNVVQTLREDVARRLDSGNVLAFPYPAGTPVRYQVEINVAQFHAISGTDAILNVSWRIVGPSGERTLSRHNGNYQEPVAGDGYDAVVTAEDRLLAQLADGIVQSLRTALRKQPPKRFPLAHKLDFIHFPDPLFRGCPSASAASAGSF